MKLFWTSVAYFNDFNVLQKGRSVARMLTSPFAARGWLVYAEHK